MTLPPSTNPRATSTPQVSPQQSSARRLESASAATTVDDAQTLKAVLASVADGVVLQSREKTIANESAQRILGVPARDFDPQALNVRTLDDRRLADDELPFNVAFACRETSRDFHVRATNLRGEEIVLAGRARLVSDDASADEVVLVFRDVTTELGEGFDKDDVITDQCLQRLLEAMPTGVHLSDARTREIVVVNDSFLALVGREREDVIGRTPPYPWWDRGHDPAPLDALVDGPTFARGDDVFRRPDGTPVHVEVLRGVLDASDGTPKALMTIASDLSDRRSFERQLVQSGKLAAIGELAAGVAHEINNPLFAILGLTEFLLADADPGTKTRERLELILETGGEIKEIVRALLDFAREPSDDAAVFVLEEVVAQTVDLIRRTNAAKGVTIIERYEAAGATVVASPNQLKQVILNLVANARQAMERGGTVTVATRHQNSTVYVAVSDTGAGIPESILARIFEPFFTTRRPVGGTGLGLSVSLGIAQSHGGTLTAESLPEGGSRFTLSLPNDRAST